MNETKPKKVANWNVAIAALGIICIVLSVSLIGLKTTYDNQTVATDRAANGLSRTMVYVNNYTIHLNSTFDNPFGYACLFSDLSNAGYFSVDVKSSTNKTYVLAKWNYPIDIYDTGQYKINYENTTYVGMNGTAYFPVLPDANVAIILGDNNTNNEATITFSITYHY